MAGLAQIPISITKAARHLLGLSNRICVRIHAEILSIPRETISRGNRVLIILVLHLKKVMTIMAMLSIYVLQHRNIRVDREHDSFPFNSLLNYIVALAFFSFSDTHWLWGKIPSSH